MTLPRYRPIAAETSPPSLELADPRPTEARRAAAALGEEVGLDAETIDGLVSAVSEVVANASLHGEPPVSLRGWGEPGRVILTVSDRGAGPSDPDVGSAPLARDPGQGGFGLWIAAQLCEELAFGRDAEGFTVRLVAGTSPPR